MRNTEYKGPSMPISEEIDKMKYRLKDETFDGKIKRISKALWDGIEHQYKLEDILGTMRFLPCLLYTSPSPRDRTRSRMPSSA